MITGGVVAGQKEVTVAKMHGEGYNGGGACQEGLCICIVQHGALQGYDSQVL